MTRAPAAGPIGEVTCVSGETFCISGTSGQIRRGGDHGLYIRDTRVLAWFTVRVGGREPLALTGGGLAPAAARFTGYLVPPDSASPDPTVLVERRRLVTESLREEVRITNYATEPIEFNVEVLVGCDLSHIFDVKHGRSLPPTPARAAEGDLVFEQGRHVVRVRATPPAEELDGDAGCCRWQARVEPGATWTAAIDVGLEEGTETWWPSHGWGEDHQVPTHPAAPPWQEPFDVRCSDQRFVALTGQSIADLASLVVVDPEAPDDQFAAAGSPWFLTLFGRDSLWAALMALPLGTELAGQTLRVLARRQGTRHDPETEEQPGKILHEVRHGALAPRADLPPLYYGSMDASPLFVTTLSEAWRWGLPDEQVEDLLPAAERALAWLRDHADPDGDGFLEYVRHGERGLANQGWKDSVDAIQFADGRLADPPIALCEVQGYAYEAALRGAELLERFDRPGSDAWRAWAKSLRDRFRGTFWVDDGDGGYPAIALDGANQRVDAVASNMGHLPATGILDPDDIGAVARRLSGEDMNSGWGLRTLTAASPRFNPLSYHGGSVWPHDTAIAVYNLSVTGHADEAGKLLRSLVASARHFDYRLPELLGGEQRVPGGFPLPYPAACRPQAWAAGSVLLLLRAALGLHPHLPDGRLELRPMWPFPYRRLHVSGLRLGGGRLSVSAIREEGLYIHEAPEGVDVRVEGAPLLDAEPPLLEPPLEPD